MTNHQMKNFLTAIKESLQARAGAGDVLEDVTSSRVYLYISPANPDDPLIWILPIGERSVALKDQYDYSEMGAEIAVCVKKDRHENLSDVYVEMMALTDAVKNVLIDNAQLICDSFPDGVIRHDETPQIEVRYTHGTLMSEGAGSGEYINGELTFRINMIRWEGVPSLG